MKRILVLLVVLFSIGFSKDLTELGNEAYEKDNYQKTSKLWEWEKACDGGDVMSCIDLLIPCSKTTKKQLNLIKKLATWDILLAVVIWRLYMKTVKV